MTKDFYKSVVKSARTHLKLGNFHNWTQRARYFKSLTEKEIEQIEQVVSPPFSISTHPRQRRAQALDEMRACRLANYRSAWQAFRNLLPASLPPLP